MSFPKTRAEAMLSWVLIAEVTLKQEELIVLAEWIKMGEYSCVSHGWQRYEVQMKKH